MLINTICLKFIMCLFVSSANFGTNLVKIYKYISSFLFLPSISPTSGAGSRGNTFRRNYTGKKPVLIQHRTQDAVNYYDHENVRDSK